MLEVNMKDEILLEIKNLTKKYKNNTGCCI